MPAITEVSIEKRLSVLLTLKLTCADKIIASIHLVVLREKLVSEGKAFQCWSCEIYASPPFPSPLQESC